MSEHAGWHPDPWQQGTWRYHDGTQWTGHTSTPAAQAPQPHPSPAAMPPSAVPETEVPAASDATEVPASDRRRIGIIGGGLAAVVVLGVVAIAVSFTGSGRGASSPEDAIRSLAAAIADADIDRAYGLLAPDETAWLLAAWDPADLEVLIDEMVAAGTPPLPDGDAPTTVADLAGAIDIEVSVSEPRVAGDEIAVVSMTAITVDIPDDSPLLDLMDEVEAEALRAELRAGFGGPGDDVTVVTVRREGGWYISPVGTALENLAANVGFQGASAERQPRSGGDSVEDALDGLSALITGQMETALDHLDPDELGILDHYRGAMSVAGAAFGANLGGETISVMWDTTTDGGDVIVEGARVETGHEDLHIDLVEWCVTEGGRTDCIGDSFAAPRDPYETALQAAFADALPPVRLITATDGGRHYISLGATVAEVTEVIQTRIDDLGPHAASLFAPAAQLGVPPTPERATAPADGTATTVALPDGWNVVSWEADAGEWPDLGLRNRLCGPPGQELDDMVVDSYDVGTISIWTSGLHAEMVHLRGAPLGTDATIDVRVIDSDEPC